MKQKTVLIIGGAGVAIAGAMCVCFLLLGLGAYLGFGPATSKRSETLAPVEATLRPFPASEPTATPTEESLSFEIPPDVQDYGLQVGDIGLGFSNAVTALTELLGQPEPENQAWLADVARQVRIIQAAHQTFTEMDVPPEMAEIHAALLEATSDCNQATEFLISGIDNQNSDDLRRVPELITSCGEKLPRSSKLLREYLQQFDDRRIN